MFGNIFIKYDFFYFFEVILVFISNNNIEGGNMKFKNIPDEEKPRERLLKYGVENLSNEELLSIILRTGNKKYNVKELSNNILCNFKDIRELKNIRINKLLSISGIGKIKAIELLASIELGRRVYEESDYDELVSLNNPSVIIKYFNNLFRDKKQEYFYVIYLDSKGNYIDKKLLYKGILNKSLVHPRDIFKEAYLLSACSFICIHNHPSGDATPSNEDINVTRNLKQIGNLHGINLIDHIIIGKDNYYSFYEDNNL